MQTLIAKTVQRHTDTYLQEQWPALLIVGPRGMAKNDVVSELVAAITNGTTEHIQSALIINPEKNITIEEIRGIKQFLKLKHVDSQSSVRVVAICDIERMSDDAQNTLLKMLEEPTEHTRYIMSASNISKVLPTVLSRSQVINLTQPSLSEAIEYFDYPKDAIEKAYRMSSGRPRYIQELLNQEESTILAAFERAKKIFQQPVYERLTASNEYATDENFELTLFAMKQILKNLLAQSDSSEASKRYRSGLGLVDSCETALKRSVNKKLLLINLLVNL